jgi:hypothetical protein
MYRSSTQILLIAAMVIAGAVAPMVRASLSCCMGNSHAAQQIALAPDAQPDLAGCGSCCVSESVATSDGAPSEHTDHDPQNPDDPCGDDCGCTLCRVMSSATTALVDGPSMMSFARSSNLAFADPDQVFARGAAFGLLRPPQD